MTKRKVGRRPAGGKGRKTKPRATHAPDYPGGATWVDLEHDPRLGSKPRPASRAATRQPRRALAKRVLDEIFPDGVPDAPSLPNKQLLQRVFEKLRAQHPDVTLTDDTVLRAAGRR